MTTSCQTDMSPKHYFYKKTKNELLGERVVTTHKRKFVHPCLTFGICCVIPSVLFSPIVLSGYFYVSLSVNSVVVSLAV